MYTYAFLYTYSGSLPSYMIDSSDGHGPFLRCLECGKVQRLQKRRAAWEDAPLAVQLPVSGVQAFNRIRCAIPIS